MGFRTLAKKNLTVKLQILLILFSLLINSCALFSKGTIEDQYLDIAKTYNYANSVSSTSYQEGLQIHKAVIEKIDNLMKSSTASEVTDRLNQDIFLKDGLSYKDYIETFIPNLESEAKAEKDPCYLAQLFISAMDNKYSKALTLPSLAPIFHKAGYSSDSLFIFEESKKLADEHNSLRKLRCLMAVADAYFEIGDKENAFKILSGSEIYLPISSSDNHFEMTLALKYNSFGNYERAIELLSRLSLASADGFVRSEIVEELIKQDLIGKAIELSESIEDLKSKVTSNLTLSKHFYDKGELSKSNSYYKDASKTSDLIKVNSDKARAIAALAKAKADAGELDLSKNLYEEAIRIAESLDDPYNPDGLSWTLQSVVLKYANSGFLEEALIAAKKIKMEFIRGETEAALCRLFAQRNEIDTATGIAKDISWFVYQGRAYSYIGEVHFKSGNEQAAQDLYRIALDASSKTENIESRKMMYYEIIKRAIQSDQTKFALELMNEMYEDVYVSSLLVELARNYVDNSRSFSGFELKQAHGLISKRFD